MKKTITICASVSFYKDIPPLEKQLKEMGFKVKTPESLKSMVKSKNFNADYYKPWFDDPSFYNKKARYIKLHNKKIIESDAILILNNEKRGIGGYIGGNVLMEMAVAFNSKKKIFILNEVSKKNPLLEEIFGVQPIILNGDISKLKSYAR